MVADAIESTTEKTMFPVVAEACVAFDGDEIHQVTDEKRQRVSSPARRKFDINKEVTTIRNCRFRKN
jgi:hypothetical protein